MADCNSNDETTKKTKTEKKPKIQQLKRKHNQKDAGLKRKPKSSLQYFCAELQAVFLPSPSELSSLWYSSPSLDLNKKVVMRWTKCHGLFDPIQVFSRFKLKGGLWTSSSSKFIPVTNRSQNVRKGQRGKSGMQETQPSSSHANTKSRVRITCRVLRYVLTVKSKQLLVFVYISQSRSNRGVGELGFNEHSNWQSSHALENQANAFTLLLFQCLLCLGSKTTTTSNFISHAGFYWTNLELLS